MTKTFDQIWDTYLDTSASLAVERDIKDQLGANYRVNGDPREVLPESWEPKRRWYEAQQVLRKEAQRRTAEVLENRFPNGTLHDFFAGEGMASIPWALTGDTQNKRGNLVNYVGKNPVAADAGALVKALNLEDRMAVKAATLIMDPNAMDEFRKRGSVVMAHTGLVFPPKYRTPQELGENPDWASVKRSLHLLGGNPPPSLGLVLGSFKRLKTGTQLQMVDTPYYKEDRSPTIQADTARYIEEAAKTSGWKVVDMQLGTGDDPFYSCLLER